MSAAHPIPISALEHYCYCERQSALILVDGVWVDNEHTVRGSHEHRRADQPSSRTERGRVVTRAMALWSEHHGLTGRADAVEFHPDGRVVPVEYKMGTRHGDAADVQLCAEALCLEEMLDVDIAFGQIWYGALRRRRRVDFNAALRQRTDDVVAAVHAQLDHRLLPSAANDERCAHCQLRGHCLPEVVAHPDQVVRFLTEEVYRCAS